MDGRGVVSRLTELLPEGAGQRVRLIFAVFPVLLAPLAAADELTGGVDVRPAGLVVMTALLVAGVWAWIQYRRNGLPWWADPVPVLALFVAAWLGTPGSALGMMFVLLYGRMLYGTGARVWLNALGYFLAFEAAVVVDHGLAGMLDASFVTTAVGVVLSAGVMRMVGEVVRSDERAAMREEVLARGASRLQHAETHDAIYELAVETALGLSADVPDVAVTLWRGDVRVLRMGGGAGQIAADTPAEVPMSVLPGGLRRQLLAGAPFALDEAASAAVQQSVQMAGTYVSMLIAPLTHGARFGGALAIAARRPLPGDLVSALGRLGGAVGLALARADSAMLLERVVENSSDAIVLLGPSLSIDFASSAAGTLFGRPPEEMTGQHIGELLRAEDDDIRRVLEGAVAGSNAGCSLATALRPDDTLRQVELAVTHMTGTAVDGWVLNLRDVTRRLEFEQALRVSERRFRSLAENVSEGMYQMVLHPEPSFEYVNPAMETMCGFPAQAFLDDANLTIERVHPDDRGMIERTRTAPDELEGPVDVRWCHPSGEWVWISFRETVVHDGDGRPIGSIGILSDVTARKQQEEALQAALGRERDASERLRHVDAMRTTFIQAVSHELRTPLTAITGYAQTLRRSRDLLDRSTHTTLLERLEANAHKLDRLLVDLLDVDRLSSHTIEPTRRQVDVVQLVHRVVEQIDGSTHPIRCDGGSVLARIDAPKVERVVENLVRNAQKYTESGTPITVTVTPDEDGDGVVLVVADEGRGIPEDLVDTVFEPFTQGADSAKSAAPGMGIGLSLVARFAEMHGGHARVENRRDGGAAFRVWLPSAAAADGDAAPRPRLVGLAAPHRRNGDGAQGTASRSSMSAS